MRTLKSANTQKRMPEQGGTGATSMPEQGGTGVRSMPEQGGTGMLFASLLAFGVAISGPAVAGDSAGIWVTEVEGEVATTIQYSVDSTRQLKISFHLPHASDGSRLYIATGPLVKAGADLTVYRVDAGDSATLTSVGAMSVIIDGCTGLADLQLAKSESEGTGGKSDDTGDSESEGTGKRLAFAFSSLSSECMIKSESEGTG